MSAATIPADQLAGVLLDIGAVEVRVVRHCAECLHDRACIGHAGRVTHRIQCGTCGHEWSGRVKRREER